LIFTRHEAKGLTFLKENNLDLYQKVLNESDKINFLNFKDIIIQSRKGKFSLKAKAKFLFRVPVRITGNTLIQKQGEVSILSLTVDKATVLGIPSRKLALYLVKKFVANEDIQISDNTINIIM